MKTVKYRLKPGQESIEVVDGPHAGRVYLKGRIYTDIPEAEARRFEEVKPTAADKTPPAAKPAAKSSFDPTKSSFAPTVEVKKE